MAQQAITPVIGIAVWFCKTLTSADVPAPMVIWIAPISADALPALCPNDARESADALGKTKPCVHRKIKMRKIVTNKSFQPKKVMEAMVTPITL